MNSPALPGISHYKSFLTMEKERACSIFQLYNMKNVVSTKGGQGKTRLEKSRVFCSSEFNWNVSHPDSCEKPSSFLCVWEEEMGVVTVYM